MKFELFSKLFEEAKEYSNADMYVAERGWQDWMDEYSNGSDATVISDILFCIYDIYNLSKMGIKELRSYEKLTFKAFSSKYSIPLRTVQDWEYGNNKTPEYIIKLISYTILQDKLENKHHE